MTLQDLSDNQLMRVYVRLWDRMTAGDGSQPWGYDSPTLRLTRPGSMRHIDDIRGEVRRRMAAGAWNPRLGKETT